jgi:hypothetical protein
MTITQQFDRMVRLVDRGERHSVLTPRWGLVEFDGDGKRQETHLEPWRSSISFHFSELTLHRELSNYPGFERTIEGPQPLTESGYITGALLPGHSDTVRWPNKNWCSFLGTGRYIEDISLRINRLQEGDTNERCEADGAPAFVDDDVEFRTQRFDDRLVFHLYLSVPRFDALAIAIERGNTWGGVIRLRGVDGCYAPHTPEITTYSVKMLAFGSEPPIDIPDSLKDVELPKLGLVRAFALELSMRPAGTSLRTVIDADTDEPVRSIPPGATERDQTLQNIVSLISDLRGQLIRVTWIAAVGLAGAIFLLYH